MPAAISDVKSTDTQSQFVNQVGTEEYPKVDPPAEAPVFLWDFSKEHVHTYAFEQENRSTMATDEEIEDDSHDRGNETSVKGSLLFKSNGDKTAKLVLQDLKISTKMIMGDGEVQTMENDGIPPMVLDGIKEDGSGPLGYSSVEMLFKIMFPLPPEPLQVGESIDIPAQIPFSAIGSLLYAKGRCRITLTRYVAIGDRTCARFDVDTDISELKVPSELKGEYKCSTKGKSVFYFDVANRCIVLGTSAGMMQTGIDTSVPQMGSSEDESSGKTERSRMAMSSDDFVRLELKEGK